MRPSPTNTALSATPDSSPTCSPRSSSGTGTRSSAPAVPRRCWRPSARCAPRARRPPSLRWRPAWHAGSELATGVSCPCGAGDICACAWMAPCLTPRSSCMSTPTRGHRRECASRRRTRIITDYRSRELRSTGTHSRDAKALPGVLLPNFPCALMPALPSRRRHSMSVEFCGMTLAHPVINGSGTFDAIAANPPPRLWEAAGGLINSIGLPNRGLAGYLAEDLPTLARELPVPLITNVMGSTAAEVSELVRACDAREEIAAIELNVSCPNVHTGLDIGADPRQLEAFVRTVRPDTRKPLIVKLTPNTADVGACARAAQAGGADVVSLIN